MREYIFCVDSDGCVMDTMAYKHELFFGPLAAKVFKVEDKEKFLEDWNRINLYSNTRGINRFLGLVSTLEQNNITEIEELKKWAYNTNELSNRSLKKEIAINNSPDLLKALEWSERVNQEASKKEGLDKPFENVSDTLEELKKNGRVVVVSSANKEAVQAEWKRHNLLRFVDELCCQDKGKKEEIIQKLKSEGTSDDCIIMIGDSPGDLDAAIKNSIHFYPILVGKESESWHTLNKQVLSEFVSNKYSDVENKYIENFWENLNNK